MMETLTIASPTSTQRPGAQRSERDARLLAYVTEPESEGVVRRAAATLLMSGVEIRRGDIRAAARDLERQRSPDILIADLSGIDLPVSAIEALAQVCEPGVRVVAVGDRNDIGLYRDLRRLGVAEYLFKPLTSDLLERVLGSLSGAAQPEATARQGRIVAVRGARGGVGTTTVAVNLAAWLSEVANRRVALVDLDIHTGSVALALNLTPGPGLREALENPGRIDEVFLERALQRVTDRLDVLAAEESLGSPVEAEPDAVMGLLGKLQSRYHYVVVDVPQALSPTVRRVLEHAATRLLVCDGTLAAARDAARLRDAFTPIVQNPQCFTVLNRRGAPGGLKPVEFAKTLGAEPDFPIDFRPQSLTEATVSGVPGIRRDARFRAGIARIAQAVSGQRLEAPGLKKWFRR
jgi:pilus assembly protein CpaE